MPLVGKKKFPYTKKGQQAAKQYAKKTGKRISTERIMKHVASESQDSEEYMPGASRTRRARMMKRARQYLRKKGFTVKGRSVRKKR